MIKKNFKIRALLIIATIIVVYLVSSISNTLDDTDYFSSAIKIINGDDYSKCPLLFEHSIKLLQEKPNSLETMYLLEKIMDFLSKKQILDNFEPIYDKYGLGSITSIGNVNYSTSKKIMISLILAAGIEKPYDGRCSHEFEITSAKGEKFLKEIALNCNDNNYKAIVEYIFIIGTTGIISNQKEIDDFISKYPNHKFLPLIYLYKIMAKINQRKSKNGEFSREEKNNIISEAQKYGKEYETIITPFGYSIADEYYFFISNLYFEFNEIKNAEEYFKILKNDKYDQIKIEELSKKLKEFN